MDDEPHGDLPPPDGYVVRILMDIDELAVDSAVTDRRALVKVMQQ